MFTTSGFTLRALRRFFVAARAHAPLDVPAYGTQPSRAADVGTGRTGRRMNRAAGPLIAVVIVITLVAGACSKEQISASNGNITTTTAAAWVRLWEDPAYTDANKIKWHVSLVATPGKVLNTTYVGAQGQCGVVPGDNALYTVQLTAVNTSDREAFLPNLTVDAHWAGGGAARADWDDAQYCGKFEAPEGGSGNYTKVRAGGSVTKTGWLKVPSPLPADLTLIAPDGKTTITSFPTK